MLKPRMNNKEEYTIIESPYKSKIVVPEISVQIQLSYTGNYDS